MKFLSVLTLCLGFLCSACGQKGPLYMPAKPPAISTPYPTTITDIKEQTTEESNNDTQ